MSRRNDHRDEDEEEERVTATSYGALDTSNVKDECWLIRVPPTLMQLLEECPEGTEIGELIFTKGGTMPNGKVVKPSLSVHISETVVEELELQKKKPATTVPSSKFSNSTTTPLNYSLEAMTKKVPVLHPFVRNPKTGSCQLLGTVTRTANLQVKQDDSYRALLRDRLVTSVDSNRYVKPMEAAESIISKRQQQASAVTASSKRGFGHAVYEFGKRKLEATANQANLGVLELMKGQQPLQKKARQFAPDQPVRSVLFELFEIQQYWTVKDLKAAAMAGGFNIDKKREQEMRDILKNEIGEYHRSGDHKSKWELLPEFRQQAKATASLPDVKK